MTDVPPSRTAAGVAWLRAAHQLLDDPPRILDDPAIAALLGPAAVERLRAERTRAQTPGARALRAHVVLRSRFAEDRLALAVARGVRQYIVLGAGYDTFIVRQPAWARDLRVVEVDRPGTQAEKRARLAAAGIDVRERGAMSPHTLRHLFATRLLRNVSNIRTLQPLLGHRALSAATRDLHALTQGVEVQSRIHV